MLQVQIEIKREVNRERKRNKLNLKKYKENWKQRGRNLKEWKDKLEVKIKKNSRETRTVVKENLQWNKELIKVVKEI